MKKIKIDMTLNYCYSNSENDCPFFSKQSKRIGYCGHNEMPEPGIIVVSRRDRFEIPDGLCPLEDAE